MITDLIVDKLVFKDVQLTATNDDQYFVFEDILYQIMLCFSRDNEINQMILSDFMNSAKSKQYEGPPSGIVPFHGICMFGEELLNTPTHRWICLLLSICFNFRSRTILLYFQFADSIIFHISCIFRAILPSIDHNKYAFARHRWTVFAVWKIIANTRTATLVTFSWIANSTVRILGLTEKKIVNKNL